MDPIFEYEAALTPQRELRGYFIVEKMNNNSRTAFIVNFLVCLGFGVISIRDKKILPYFVILTVFITLNVLYQQFFSQKVTLYHQARLYKKSLLKGLPCRLRVYPDRIETRTLGGPEAPESECCYPYNQILDVIETPDCFYLYISAEKVIPIPKTACSPEEQSELRILWTKACKSYVESKLV